MELSDRERDEVIALIKAGRPLPARYRATLFDDAATAELIWPGKTNQVERAVLPFQSIEHIDEPRTEKVAQIDLFSVDEDSGRQSAGWTNKLIWGDNKLILSSLAHGPLRTAIDDAGGLKLIYIDPPFDVGADFSIEVEVGNENVTKQASVVEDVAYRDTWGRGVDSYLSMMRERLVLMRDLLADDGLIWVHLDWHVGHYVKLLLDEVFGRENFINEIARVYAGGGQSKEFFPRKHDPIFLYAKGKSWTFNADAIRVPYDSDYKATVFTKAGSRAAGKTYTPNDLGKIPEDWWLINRPYGDEIVAYPTQKPEALLDRIIRVGTDPGDLVADFFCGSGTTLAVAEKLGRKWIGSDLGRFAIHTSRKRLIQIQRRLQEAGQTHRAFEILNLGSYERQYFVGVDMSLGEKERMADSDRRRGQFLDLILHAYSAQRAAGVPPFHGVKGRTAVLVGPLDSPVTQMDVQSAVDAARDAGITRVDILGFEFEFGITPALADDAKELGVSLTLRYIPNDVFDKRAIARQQVNFRDVGYVEVSAKAKKDHKLTLTLSDFGVFYSQQDADAAAAGLKPGTARVVIDGGQVVRVSKDKKGIASREILTKRWSDWIDYWAIDFDFESQRELVRVVRDGEERQEWTGRYVFENQWQSFRTRSNRDLDLTSATYQYASAGTYRVAVKVIDVFGNDTTKVITVKVP